MTPDPLDDLLARSAPAVREASPDALGTMIGEARAEARPPRRRRFAIPVGIGLSALLVGTAGVAVATDGFTWAPWAQDPVGAVAFTMSNGFSCELRFSEYSSGSDAAFLAEVNRVLEEWHRSTDVVSTAQTQLPAKLLELENTLSEAEMDPEADMSVLTPEEQDAEIAHRAWTREWLAWDLVVADLESDALRDAGILVGDGRFAGSERSGQIQCLDETGRAYVPGADS